MPKQRRIAVMMGLDHGFKRHVRVFAGIHDYAKQADWGLIVDEWADHTLPARVGKPIPYDGVIGRITSQGARRAQRLDLPVVNVWYSSPAQGLPMVHFDLKQSGRLVAEHLLDRGFRNLGAMINDFDATSLVQADAMQRVATEAGYGDRYSQVILGQNDTHKDWLRSVEAVERWMNTWQLPIGVFIRDAVMARMVIELCTARGWNVPNDVAMVAAFNEEEVCNRPAPSLSSLEVPYEKQGYEAARMLDELIDAKQNKNQSPFAKPKLIQLQPAGIVARHSTDFFAVEDEIVSNALRFIATHLDKKLDVNMVAEALTVSRRTLDSRFHSKLGKTVASEIQRLRIERVKRELVGSKTSIYKIAPLAGFPSTRTLNDQFQRIVGMSPREYRKQMMK